MPTLILGQRADCPTSILHPSFKKNNIASNSHPLKKLVFATQNPHKLQEINQMMGHLYHIVTPIDFGITEEIPETGDTFHDNALQKANYLLERTDCDCFADDSGLELLALNGAPGVYSARYAGEQKDPEANMNLLLRNLEDQTDRSARFVTVIAFIREGEHYFFEGEIRGKIIHEKRGEKGFGYDPIFMPDGYDRTFAEMTAEEKNTISHRKIALSKLTEFLEHSSSI